MEQVARRILGPRPYGHGQKHDVHHRKAGDAKPHEQITTAPVGFGGGQKAGVKLECLVPDSGKTGDQVVGGHAGFGIDADTLHRQIDARGSYARGSFQRPFDCRNRFGTFRRRQRQDKAAGRLGAAGGYGLGRRRGHAGHAGRSRGCE